MGITLIFPGIPVLSDAEDGGASISLDVGSYYLAKIHYD